MSLIIAILFIFFLFVIRTMQDRISRFIAYSFTIYWMLSLFISTFQPMGYYAVSDIAYTYLLMAVASFIFGFSTQKLKCKSLFIDTSALLDILTRVLSNKYFLFFLIAISLYLFSYASEALAASLVTGKAVRATGDDAIFINDGLFVLIYSNICYPIFHMILVMLPLLLFNFKRSFIFPLSVIIFFLISYFIVNASRSNFVILFLYVLIMYCIYKQGKFKFSLRSFVWFSTLICIVLIGISAITNFRDYGTFQMDENSLEKSINDTNEKILNYSVLPIVLFDRSLKEDYMTKLGGPFFGRATFAGPELYIGNVIEKFFSNYKTVNDQVISYIQANYFPISSKDKANFAYTGVFFHYQDFGVLGVIIFPFCFGVFFRRILFAFYKRQSFSLLLLVGFLYFLMMYSIFSCYLIKPWVTFYLIVLLVLSFYKIRLRKVTVQ